MAKDPRFNFYPDNYMGGTIGFTLEQHGAYIQLLILQSKVGKFTEQQALNHLASLTHGDTAVYTKLWKFLIPKFVSDGDLFFSERLLKEMSKSKAHSEKQAERVKNRWNKKEGDTAVIPATQVLPVNRTGNGIGNGTDKKGVQGETEDDRFSDYQKWTDSVTNKTDPLFEQMLMGEQVAPNGQLKALARSHLELLARYPNMRPLTQQLFRYSLLRHIKEKIDKKNTHGTINLSQGKDFGKLR